MPLIEGVSEESYRSKFVRLDGQIYVTRNLDFKSEHIQLVKTEDLLEEFKRLSGQPEKLDAGTFEKRGRFALFDMASATLWLPQSAQARLITAQLYESKIPGSTAFTRNNEFLEALRENKP